MLPRVTEALHLGEHRLWLRFSDGDTGEIDLSKWLTFDGVFEPLRDEKFFARVTVIEEAGTIGWPNDVDLCPDVLYARVTGNPLPEFASAVPSLDLEEASSLPRPERRSPIRRSTATDAPNAGRGSREGTPMPIISRFFGITLLMYFDDHAPPHFHARYQRFKAMVGVDPTVVLQGRLPPRVMGMVIEWATQHRAELLADWQLARQRRPLRKIEPLE